MCTCTLHNFYLYELFAAVTCPPLKAPGNGTINCSSSDDGPHYVGDICTYTCDSGFVLDDTDNRECRENGSWNGTELFCDQGTLRLPFKVATNTHGLILCHTFYSRLNSW